MIATDIPTDLASDGSFAMTQQPRDSPSSDRSRRCSAANFPQPGFRL
jgi:hypothetical protein